jgi:putative ABC transport system ATP-binding protein
VTGVAATSVPESVADYAALPGPGGQRSKLPALDAKGWTLRVALSQRPWSFVASIAMAAAFVCNGLTPVVVGQAVDEAIATSSLQRLGFWIMVLAGLYLVAIGVNWIARFMLVRSQQLVSHDLRTLVTDRIQDPRGFAGRERTPGGLLLIASADTQRVGEIVMMTVMPVAEASAGRSW